MFKKLAIARTNCRARARGRREAGQALVEFALVLPLLMLLIFLFIEFGIGFARYNEVVNGAREGARLGAVQGGTAAVVEAAIDAQVMAKVPNVALTAGDIDVRYVGVDGNGVAGPGDSVVVEITFTYDTVTPLASFANAFTLGAFPTDITMSACADMRLEAAVSGATEGSGC